MAPRYFCVKTHMIILKNPVKSMVCGNVPFMARNN